MSDNINDKILLSIAIPTWNRARILEKLLDNVSRQAEEFKGKVEICVSNNGSTDDTREVVLNFQKKYPGLIRYNENKENTGFDRNMLKSMDMAEGSFVWTFGDDDKMIENCLSEVFRFIEKNYKGDTGLIVLKSEAYFIDKQTGEKVVCYDDGSSKNQPEVYAIDRKDIIGLLSPDLGFISTLIFNNRIVKKVFEEDKDIIEKAVGTYNAYMALYSLMFLRNPYLKGVALNKKIVFSELANYKFFIEDTFKLHYERARKLYRLMASIKGMDESCIPSFVERDNDLRRAFMVHMISLRTFGSFNYFSYFGCLKLFFSKAPLIDALLFSFVFSILFIIPPAVLKLMYKGLLMIRHGKEWKTQWQLVYNMISRLSGGTRRRTA